MEKEKDLSITEATSMNKSHAYCAIEQDIQNMIAGEKEKIIQQRFTLPYSYQEFCQLLTEIGTSCLIARKQQGLYVIDSTNEPVIRQLYLYATYNLEFDGNLDKGIMLQGKYGSGKTILMESYSILYNLIIRKFGLRYPILTFIKSVELQNLLKEQNANNFSKRPLVIDEFGRESKMILHFGNALRPISELLSIRSDIAVVTHGTTNFTLQTLSSDDFYGQMIGDRLKAMFNFIELPGNSRRE